MSPAIAIVGMACRYPDAASPVELWENVLAQRRAFRQLPAERLNTADYFSTDPNAPDRTYSMIAALIEDYEFDRVRHRVSGKSYRAADLAHWLALDIAGRALADAGFGGGEGLPREATGVFLGNTLTGEFSRAAALRLRWPFVRRVVSAALQAHGMEPNGLMREIEEAYKRPFAEVGEETLAGGLSNTIAGRICNYFDLKGGGFTVDGACASSLLAVSTACSALAAGDCEVAMAGGVDLSLDPFELVGFAKTGALAPEKMRVYDVRSAGFWPGEGCGFAILMRYDDAVASGRRVYSLIRGWGISSDGSGGITRPEVEGQLLAFRRAYRRAGFGPDSVACFEGHGTGTAVGDATELRVITRARAEAGASAPAAIGSVKANIGHTKAAAGIAGLIKAAMAVHTQVLPPATGCEAPHPAMGEMLRVLRRPECWPADQPLRAAVSAMGFGGINSHIVMEGAATARRNGLAARECLLAGSPQDAELFLFASPDRAREVAEMAGGLSLSEMTDLAASLAAESATSHRLAVVASTPQELARKLSAAVPVEVRSTPRIGFLFPGQGSQNTAADTAIAQPAIVRESLQSLRELTALGIEASAAIGHSLGELSALCWAGVMDESAAIAMAAERGRLMSAVAGPPGGMAGIRAGEEEVRRLIAGSPVVVAGINSRKQTVVAGAQEAVNDVVARARAAGLHAVPLAVSHAFHSPLIAPAAAPFSEYLASVSLAAPRRCVISTVTGAAISPDDDLRALLRRQVAEPVRFRAALEAAGEVDLWIEAGPGRVLSGLAAETVSAPVLPVESGSGSRRALLEAVAAAFERGVSVRASALFENRFTRPFRGRRKFFVNPCELAPAGQAPAVETVAVDAAAAHAAPMDTGAQAIDVVRALVAERAELPHSSISADARLLADLHLNSIVVAQIATEAARRLGISPPATPLDYAGLTLAEAAQALQSSAGKPAESAPAIPAGIDSWVRPFRSRLVPRARSAAALRTAGPGEWQFFGPHEGTLRGALEAAADALPAAGGVVLCLPAGSDARVASGILAAAQAAVRLRGPAIFLLVQHGGGAASVARTLHWEARDLPVCVVVVPLGLPDAVERVAAEAAAVRQYTEAHYDASGARYEPALSLAALEAGPFPLGPEDVLLVSGGGKGIGAECAIAVARATGAKLALLGSSAADQPELAANLRRIESFGLRAAYFRADVTDAAAVRSVCDAAGGALGPITAILHCAGVNHPQAVEALQEEALRRTITVKTAGLANLLAACDSGALKLVTAFGSIIARMGLAGEADYALANEWMARDLERWSSAHPGCRCLTLEWSVWAGAGMGDRVAHLDYLKRMGVSAISLDEGVRAFLDCLRATPPGSTTLVMAARFGAPPTVQFDAPELPLLRFLERTPVHYPGVELICEADLSTANDPYLADHVFSGALLLPAVIAMEAMAQAAMALTGALEPPAMTPVRFLRPMIVPAGGTLTVRILALVRAPGEVEVCLRSSETAFQTDHFRATCRFNRARAIDRQPWTADVPAHPVALDPARHLYGGLLFQEGRFRRLQSYLRLRATECVAVARAEEPLGWFNRYLPQKLVLGDAGLRDTAIHAIQACIPHARVLPAGALSIEFGAPAPGPHQIHARERSRDGDVLVYDLEIATPAGEVVERWSGLELRIVHGAAPPGPLAAEWPAALLGPYLERRVAESAPASGVSVLFGENGATNGIAYRADGKPLLPNGHMSRSHAGPLTLTVKAGSPVGCDCEPIAVRTPEVWRDLLGSEGFSLAGLLAREAHEEVDRSCTRVWCALESVRKAGGRSDLSIVFAAPEENAVESAGWITLGAGGARIFTLVAPVAEQPEPLAFAVMVDS